MRPLVFFDPSQIPLSPFPFSLSPSSKRIPLRHFLPQRGGLAEAEEVTVTDDEVVEEGDGEDLGGGEEVAGEGNVVGAGFGVAGGVVVGDDEADGSLANGFAEDVAGVGDSFGGGAHADDLGADEAVFDIEEEDGEALLDLPHEFLGEEGGCDRRIVHDSFFVGAGVEDALSEFDRGQNGGGFGGADTGDLGEFLDTDIAQGG